MIIGVTGHMNLKQTCLSHYRSMLFNKLSTLKNKHENIQVYSALAEGADRLVVEVAMSLKIDYIAVLPMSINQCNHNWSEESKVKFQYFLDNSLKITEYFGVKLLF